MNLFLQKLIDDLKQFSTDLLAPGLHSTQQIPTSMGTVASTTALLKAIDFLSALVPQLITELQTIDVTHKWVVHYSNTPKQALFSRRASDYQQDANKRVLPAHWVTILPVSQMDTRPLRWLLYLLDLQKSSLSKVYNRTTKYIEDSLLSQQGKSSYAENDRATLLSMQSRLDEADAKLSHARLTLLKLAQQRLVPSPNIPYPYPRAAGWTRLRRFSQQLMHPDDYLPGFLQTLLNGTVEIADTPYLYQRWCGVKLLQTFETLGWIRHVEATGALFLGGEICLYKSDVQLSIWIEPRFSKRKTHPSGFSCQSVLESHPDYLIVTPGPNGVDAFILDPTTTADADIRNSKGRYLSIIEAQGMGNIAGVPVVRHPLRAWSAAPLHSSRCELQDSNGQTGTVPMHPLNWNSEPLREWVQDIDNYAIAWGRFARLANYS